MAKDSTKSMTEGKPFSLIMGFALPVFFGLLFQQFYSMVDTMIVGKFLGEDALGAVGATGSRSHTSSVQKKIPICAASLPTVSGSA